MKMIQYEIFTNDIMIIRLKLILLRNIFGKECPQCKERWNFDGYECSNCGYDVAIAEWNRMYNECMYSERPLS